MLQEGEQGYPLRTCDCPDQGHLKSDNLPNKGGFTVEDEFLEASDGDLQVVLGDRLIFGVVHKEKGAYYEAVCERILTVRSGDGGG